MAKYTKEELAEAKKQTSELLKLLLKKTSTKYSDIVSIAEQEFIASNLDVLTLSEKKRFNKLIL